MQTFLSENNFIDSAAVLDNKRLNKQLLEGYQILNAIALTPAGGGSRVNGKVPFTSNHPATNQWRGYEGALMTYLTMVEIECRKRGIKTDKNWTNILGVYQPFFEGGEKIKYGEDIPMPRWWTDPVAGKRLMITHRRNLWWKDHDHYQQYMADARMVDSEPVAWVCCSTHAPYYYPTHTKEFA